MLGRHLRGRLISPGLPSIFQTVPKVCRSDGLGVRHKVREFFVALVRPNYPFKMSGQKMPFDIRHDQSQHFSIIGVDNRSAACSSNAAKDRSMQAVGCSCPKSDT